MRAVHLCATEERGEREPKGQAQFNATTVRGGTGRGVMICSNFKGHTLGHIDDTTNFTKAQALDEALGFGTNDLMGRFSLNMATDEIAQVMNRAELIDYCEERERSEMSDGEKPEQS
jgi:hypothetical protein